MSNKLKGLPTIHYLNHHENRIEYMESQFDKWEIYGHRTIGTNRFKRFHSGIFVPGNYDEWKHRIYKPEFLREEHYLSTCITISTLEMIRDWLQTTNEKYLILFEDDYDMNLIEHWHFDWGELMNNLPYDWDCIQLGFESHNYVSFFLHPKTKDSAFGPVLINRWFAEKLLRIHTVDGKYFFLRRHGGYPGIRSLSIDEFFGFVGRVYQVPLITCRPELDERPKPHHFACRDLYYEWWENERQKFTVKDFFTYGKKIDSAMTHPVVIR